MIAGDIVLRDFPLILLTFLGEEIRYIGFLQQSVPDVLFISEHIPDGIGRPDVFSMNDPVIPYQFELQGRVYSARNTLQFFTIPLGYLCGGILVDRVFEPFMAAQPTGSLWVALFGVGKGSGAALLFLVIGIFGALSSLPFRADKSFGNWKNSRPLFFRFC